MPFNQKIPIPKLNQPQDSRKRVLFMATVDYHFKLFHLPTLRWFQELGWQVHLAAYGDMEIPYVDVRHHLVVDRSPFRTNNIKAYFQLKEIIEVFQFDLIHCHTPMGGVLTRLAARGARKSGTIVLYTAHGFHFCKGAPLQNWLIYYPIEKGLAKFTDGLITINEEDHSIAERKHFRAQNIFKVNGVGVDTDTFKPISEKEKNFLRTSYGYRPEDVLLFYAAEFNANKNQQLLIRALSLLKNKEIKTHLLLAGSGQLMETCQTLAKELGVSEYVHFLGYQNDVLPFLHLSDIAVASSLREGLPVNIMEAMACGLPVVATDNRGHRELIHHGENGFVSQSKTPQNVAHYLNALIHNVGLRHNFGKNGFDRIHQQYSKNLVMEENKAIYSYFMEGESQLEWVYQ